MSEPLLILSVLFIFALLVQLVSYLYKSQQSLRALRKEVNTSTQAMLDYRRKSEWLESRLEDLLDATQLQSCDAGRDQQQLDRLIRTIKTEAMQNGFRVGLGDLDPLE